MRVQRVGRPGPPDSYGRRRLVLREVGRQVAGAGADPTVPPSRPPPGRSHLVITMPGPGQEIRLMGVAGCHPRPGMGVSDRGFRTGWGQSQSVRDKETEEADTGKGTGKLGMLGSSTDPSGCPGGLGSAHHSAPQFPAP